MISMPRAKAKATSSIIIMVVLLASALDSSGQDSTQDHMPIRAAFYNIQNLFDTIDSPFIYDNDFTPGGRYDWNSERYNTKIQDIARVADDLRADVIALAEIENEQVVRDLVMASQIDYAYFHHNSSDSRGIDIAMLYRPERLFIDSMQVYKIEDHRREVITLFGSMGSRRVIFSACHLPSHFRSDKIRESVARSAGKYFRDLAQNNPGAVCIIAGDFNFTPDSKLLKDIIGSHEDAPLVSTMDQTQPLGTYIYNNRLMIYDYILVDKATAAISKTQIFAADYLLEHSVSRPVSIKPTYSRGSYRGGASDHLPILVVVGE